ncbi:endonuclease/exonuclease/phosphatase family protein [Colwellia sp. 4_MG-2023]|uniref:endonuclease/exonuclease/phosphatase family protein n=1 Tax=unclassified Colwellia TaxID=196834 RepID=UPI0026E1B1B5|nr:MULTISPECIES: endonuclease/exonuclease/phosphatase family protein [unclassified Colwellia]MDO6506831.1 endonuclease/exonuclease/phosphatase family protein [Colwellia sp. 5_MG-2023]MDO6555794.1 endonuclease/exonuclease/phosphatase family protein [Colwellia sp. 4_MG-2023]
MNINTKVAFKQKNPTFTLVSINIGEGIELKHLMSVMRFHDPDIFTLQEAGRITNIDKLDSYPFQDCKGNLCLISKYPFEKINSFNNDMYKGYGDWAAFYKIDINGVQINMANVHFPSVRRIFPRFDGIKDIHQNRTLSALLIENWAQSKQNVIIAGDFNMSVIEGIYQQTFKKYQNALSDKGNGFNNTVDYKYKGIGLPSVRIDHILLSQNFNIEKALVLEALGGDHYPILSSISLKEH